MQSTCSSYIFPYPEALRSIGGVGGNPLKQLFHWKNTLPLTATTALRSLVLALVSTETKPPELQVQKKKKKKKSSKNKQLNQPYLHKMTAGDLAAESSENFTGDLILRNYFCNLFLINCSRDWELLGQHSSMPTILLCKNLFLNYLKMGYEDSLKQIHELYIEHTDTFIKANKNIGGVLPIYFF